MPRRLHIELEKLKKMILSLGGMVEERVRLAILAIDRRDRAIAEQVINGDHEVDEMEVEMEEECLKVMALYQPVAVDLRFINTVIKINNDLERIADEAVNIAERVDQIQQPDNAVFPFDHVDMGEKSERLLKLALDALVNMDADLAYHVCKQDDEVDAIKDRVYEMAVKAMADHPDKVKHIINLLLISRHIERIADHATNIAEEVIYLIEGEIIRHGHLKE